MKLIERTSHFSTLVVALLGVEALVVGAANLGIRPGGDSTAMVRFAGYAASAMMVAWAAVRVWFQRRTHVRIESEVLVAAVLIAALTALAFSSWGA